MTRKRSLMRGAIYLVIATNLYAQTLDIQIAPPRRLADRPGGFPGIQTFSDGSIIVTATSGIHQAVTGPMITRLYDHFKNGGGFSGDELAKIGCPSDTNLGGGYWALRSTDGGNSWSPTTVAPGRLSELPDGSILANYVFSINRPDDRQELITWRSNDKGRTWSTAQFVPLIAPPQKDTWGDGLIGGCYYGGIITLPDKSLLLFGHTRFEGDRKYRVVVLRSTDLAKSFHYYATIAYEDNNSTTLRPIGFCEPEAIRLKNGELLCFMRTAEYEPLFMSRSTNEGRTWSDPQRIGVDGILPTPVLLDNGVLALSYGRPGVWVIFSTDNARWWTDKKCVWTWNSLWGEGHLPKTRHYTTPGYHTYECSDCNARIAQIAPNRLMIVYNAPLDPSASEPLDHHDGPGRSTIYSTTIDVKLK